MTSVVISQPMYFPWPGFIAQLALADVVVWLDDAQYSKGSFTNRVQVRLPGGISWLSIPLVRSGSKTFIHDLVAAKEDWLDGHKATLRQSFQGAPYAASAMTCLDQVAKQTGLCDALIASSQSLADVCGISPSCVLQSSSMTIDSKGSDRVLRIVKEMGGTRYITGHGAHRYLDHAAFEAENVEVEYMQYDVKPWEQSGQTFTPYVTTLDLLASVGPSKARAHLNPQTVNWKNFAPQ